ncbi:MAG: peptide chain release factor N(5)-glutamine methyltransferase [Candidatus Liberibacter europaeus]|uniref:peptide chain release factor N(5)-glutamine methyltransferase n=1 Tax=Candidatus Liberibacter europaeus TaxID=744859 RepID=A0A2T4VYB5_9HYPH|nr:MAG: peptide chain release factor N(5)-glutamine methyltransferase [Candidatus Liberibacter europaeus]
MIDSSLIVDIPYTVEDCLSLVKDCFNSSGLKGIGDPRSFLCGVTGLSSCQIITCPDRIIEDKQRLFLKKSIIKYLNCESIHRILGWRCFYNVKLSLSADTFEPRPETELLVDVVSSYFISKLGKKREVRLLDLGTGTGAICLALLKEHPHFKGVGVDVSRNALKIAEKNAVINNLSERFCAVQSNWFSSINGIFDIIVSNPPYISSALIGSLGSEVKDFDPLISLDGGVDGLSHYRIIADGLSRHLSIDGFCSVEIGYDQKIDVVRIFADRQLLLVNSFKDYGGNDRVLLFCR